MATPPPPLSTVASQLDKPATLFPPIERYGLIIFWFLYLLLKQQYMCLRYGLIIFLFIFAAEAAMYVVALRAFCFLCL